jgi:hypothetical protein
LLVDAERKMITSGSVFVFDEDESGIKRWTDGLYWSPSRILGNFLLYRETDKRGAGHRRAERAPPQDPWEHDDSSLSRPKNDKQVNEKQRERSLVGSLTNSYKFKHDGLMKKTFSLTIGGVAQHLISYYKVEDVETGRLRSPSSIPELAALEISPEYLDKTHFRIPPKVEIGRDGRPHYVGEADDGSSGGEAEHPLAGGAGGSSSGGLLPKPLLTDVPIALEPSATIKRSSGSNARRYEPYEATSPSTAKRRRGKQGSLGGGPTSPGSDPTQSPQSPHSATLDAAGDDPASPYGYPANYYTPYPAPGPYSYSGAYSATPQQIPYSSFAEGGSSSSSSSSHPHPHTSSYSYYPSTGSSSTAGGYTSTYSWSPAYPSAYNPGATSGSVYPPSTAGLSAPRAIREGNEDSRRA